MLLSLAVILYSNDFLLWTVLAFFFFRFFFYLIVARFRFLLKLILKTEWLVENELVFSLRRFLMMVIQLNVVFIVKAFVRSLMIEISNIIAEFIFLILTMIVIIPIMYSISLAQLLLAAQINTKSTTASPYVFKFSINRIAWISLCAYQQTLQLFLVHWLICNNLMLLLSVFFVVSGLLS